MCVCVCVCVCVCRLEHLLCDPSGTGSECGAVPGVLADLLVLLEEVCHMS